jgi:hypothetical protein
MILAANVTWYVARAGGLNAPYLGSAGAVGGLTASRFAAPVPRTARGHG